MSSLQVLCFIDPFLLQKAYTCVVFNAGVGNLLGIVITPLLLFLFTDITNLEKFFEFALLDILLLLIVPFATGQLLRILTLFYLSRGDSSSYKSRQRLDFNHTSYHTVLLTSLQNAKHYFRHHKAVYTVGNRQSNTTTFSSVFCFL